MTTPTTRREKVNSTHQVWDTGHSIGHFTPLYSIHTLHGLGTGHTAYGTRQHMSTMESCDDDSGHMCILHPKSRGGSMGGNGGRIEGERRRGLRELPTPTHTTIHFTCTDLRPNNGQLTGHHSLHVHQSLQTNTGLDYWTTGLLGTKSTPPSALLAIVTVTPTSRNTCGQFSRHGHGNSSSTGTDTRGHYTRGHYTFHTSVTLYRSQFTDVTDLTSLVTSGFAMWDAATTKCRGSWDVWRSSKHSSMAE
eukprot:GFYU01000136.1.p1 GENE.GFYU01000136.1~~GFYU01000136.1.p1  ORF type:complete len:249 (-),score=13.07 GFYU01000136.1:396-1142(-)